MPCFSSLHCKRLLKIKLLSSSLPDAYACPGFGPSLLYPLWVPDSLPPKKLSFTSSIPGFLVRQASTAEVDPRSWRDIDPPPLLKQDIELPQGATSVAMSRRFIWQVGSQDVTWATRGPSAQMCRSFVENRDQWIQILRLHISMVTAAAAEEGTVKAEEGAENPEVFFYWGESGGWQSTLS